MSSGAETANGVPASEKDLQEDNSSPAPAAGDGPASDGDSWEPPAMEAEEKSRARRHLRTRTIDIAPLDGMERRVNVTKQKLALLRSELEQLRAPARKASSAADKDVAIPAGCVQLTAGVLVESASSIYAPGREKENLFLPGNPSWCSAYIDDKDDPKTNVTLDLGRMTRIRQLAAIRYTSDGTSCDPSALRVCDAESNAVLHSFDKLPNMQDNHSNVIVIPAENRREVRRVRIEMMEAHKNWWSIKQLEFFAEDTEDAMLMQIRSVEDEVAKLEETYAGLNETTGGLKELHEALTAHGFIDVDTRLAELDDLRSCWEGQAGVRTHRKLLNGSHIKMQSIVEKEKERMDSLCVEEAGFNQENKQVAELERQQRAERGSAQSSVDECQAKVEDLRRQLEAAEARLSECKTVLTERDDRLKATEAQRDELATKLLNVGGNIRAQEGRLEREQKAACAAYNEVTEWESRQEEVDTLLKTGLQKLQDMRPEFDRQWRQWKPYNIGRWVARVAEGKYSKYEEQARTICEKKGTLGRHLVRPGAIVGSFGIDDMDDTFELEDLMCLLVGRINSMAPSEAGSFAPDASPAGDDQPRGKKKASEWDNDEVIEWARSDNGVAPGHKDFLSNLSDFKLDGKTLTKLTKKELGEMSDLSGFKLTVLFTKIQEVFGSPS